MFRVVERSNVANWKLSQTICNCTHESRAQKPKLLTNVLTPKIRSLFLSKVWWFFSFEAQMRPQIYSSSKYSAHKLLYLLINCLANLHKKSSKRWKYSNKLSALNCTKNVNTKRSRLPPVKITRILLRLVERNKSDRLQPSHFNNYSFPTVYCY